MFMEDFKFDLGSRVALKPEVEKVYRSALPGNEGWIRDHKHDSAGFRLVYIEWDKEHWRYNGQIDGWTFEDHFKVIKAQDKLPELEVPEEEEDEKLLTDPRAGDDEDIAEYIDTMSEAFEAASMSQGFFMICVKKSQNPDGSGEILMPEMYGSTLSDEMQFLIEAQLAECVAASHQDLIYKIMNQILQNRKKEE